MWITSVIIFFIIFLMMFFNRAEEESVFVIAGLLLAVIVRFGNFMSKQKFEYKVLENKFSDLEEELRELKSSRVLEKEQPTEETLKEEIIKVESFEQNTIIEEVDSTSTDEYFQTRLNKRDSSFIDIKEDNIISKKVSNAENFVDNLFANVIGYFTKGNPLVKIGGVLLFFGLSFLIKFAAENDMVSIEMGLISVIVFSFGLIGLGWKHRKRVGSFGLILQGIGIAVFYLSIFSSAKYFDILPFSLALAIMVLTVVFASFLAVAQNSMSLAIFATAGGFISPILTSTGEGSHVVLFSYYALLNISIISIAWFKSWRPLNLTGFVFTFIISAVWGASRYTPELFWSTEPFLIFFFLLYLGVVVIFAFKSEYKLKAYVDSSLLFGVPVTAFAMQGALVSNYEYALSFSALAVSCLYLSIAWKLRKKEHMSLLAESFLALGVVFITLAIPFAVSEHWTAVTWALESTAIIWISLRQNRVYSRYIAVVLQILAVLIFANESKYILKEAFVFNVVFLGGIFISIAAFITSYVFEKFEDKLKEKEHILKYVFIGIGLLSYLSVSSLEIKGNFDYFQTYLLAFISLSGLGFAYLAKRLEFKTMQEILIGFLPLGLFILLASVDMYDKYHPFIGVGWLAIPLFILTHYFILYRFSFKTEKLWHVAGLWLIMLTLTWEFSYYISKVSVNLSYASYPVLSILAIVYLSTKREIWPLKDMHLTYKYIGLSGISFMLVLFNLFLFLSSGYLIDIGYIPLLNPLDIMQISSIIAVIYWLNSIKEGLLSDKKIMYVFMGASTVSLLTVILARSIHAFFDVRYRIDYLLESYVFQASLSILYSVLALILIIIAKRKTSRIIWIVGASLLGFVTLKLFFVELSHSGTLSRIVSFMAVGILILIIGYLAPLPPKKLEKEEEKTS